MEQNKTTMNLRQKLFEIQKSHQTFAQTEDSEKKANGKPGKSAYTYTPGWKIIESIRAKMDELRIMLDSTLVGEEHEMISYTVYKEVAGQIIPFEKKEMYVTVRRAYTWIDIDSGEMIGPIVQGASGANGTDKSIASAESLCERYFLLKQFHITTREMDDEPDAHDCSTIPGNINYPDAKDYGSGRGYSPMQQQAPATPAQQQHAFQQVPPAPGYQFSAQNQTAAPQDPHAAYEAAINELANFGKGTQSHTNVLNKWLIALNQCGYDTSVPTFAGNLIEAALAKRERRAPSYK